MGLSATMLASRLAGPPLFPGGSPMSARRNLVAVLAEERVAFGVTRPKAFVKATVAS